MRRLLECAYCASVMHAEADCERRPPEVIDSQARADMASHKDAVAMLTRRVSALEATGILIGSHEPIGPSGLTKLEEKLSAVRDAWRARAEAAEAFAQRLEREHDAFTEAFAKRQTERAEKAEAERDAYRRDLVIAGEYADKFEAVVEAQSAWEVRAEAAEAGLAELRILIGGASDPQAKAMHDVVKAARSYLHSGHNNPIYYNALDRALSALDALSASVPR